MEIIHKYMHHVDFEEEEVTVVPVDGYEAEIFINNVINETLENEHTRKYERKSDTTEVINSVNKLIRYEIDDFENIQIGSQDSNSEQESAIAIEIDEIVERIAERLMESEIDAQQSIAATGKRLRKGSLIQVLLKYEDSTYKYALLKIDHSAYLDKESLSKRIGLPLEEKILKSCVIEYDLENKIKDINLYDSTKKMADYWWNGLLELKPINNDDLNTKKSMSRIFSTIDRYVGKESPADATVIKNKARGYYNTNTEFDLNEFLQVVVDNHTLNSGAVDKEILKDKIKKMSERHFDGQFNINLDAIKKDKAEIFKVEERISLTLYDEIENLTDRITVEDDHGKYNLKLMDISEEMYNKFNY